MNLQMAMQLMTKKSKMSMMEKMTLSRTKDLLAKDITYMLNKSLNYHALTDNWENIILLKKNQMTLPMLIKLMTKKSKMNKMMKMKLSKTMASLDQDITCMLRKKRSIVALNT